MGAGLQQETAGSRSQEWAWVGAGRECSVPSGWVSGSGLASWEARFREEAALHGRH